LISGITDQDGSYPAELLLSKGYELHGLIRRASSFNMNRVDHLYVDSHQPGARLLQAIRRSGIKTRFYRAFSSEMFGNAPAPQNESTPFYPQSPYAAAKVYAY